MKIQKEDFLKKITNASRFTSSKISSSNVLQGVCLKKDKDKLHFYSTNLNTYYHGFLKNNDKEEFFLIIEPKKIIEFISLLKEGFFDIEAKENKLIITQDKTKAVFPAYNPNDFPFLSLNQEKKEKIEVDFFKKAIPLLSFAASTDETRPVLTGIMFFSNEEKNYLVSTDGFRMSLFEIEEKLPFSQSIVPASFLTEILRFLDEKNKTLDYSFNNQEKTITFYFQEEELTTRLIDGEYPPFERVIPKETKTTVILEKDEFLRNIKIISVFARDLSNIVVFNIKNKNFEIHPKITDDNKAVTNQEAEIKGEEIKIAFNFRFLIDFLTNINSKKIIIEFLRPDAPVVFKGEEEKNFLHIIMPVRIQD